ncbi:hypothetical protein K2173_023457 [Erythroxylum novogranatense]|uniref:Alkyl transferase n=1 Tax=Erythroxylum novogranatense TaxID=1862640 RepID=A0AAV8TVW3_9ROSI|nr:hypothetical protein K2173_023457 [Erythroxylum novogranatense]
MSSKMKTHTAWSLSVLFSNLGDFLRRCMFRILFMGPIPTHFAFIMDGNRRFAKKKNLEEGTGHRAGFLALMNILKYCYELGVKYVTIYAFSIENFKRRPDEVENLMNLMLEKIEELLEEESIVNQYGVRVYFIGNLKLLSEPVRVAAENAMRATAKNSKCSLLICVAYTSLDEILHAVQESCKEIIEVTQPCNSHKMGFGDRDSKKSDNAVKHVQESCKHDANESRVLKAGVSCNGDAGAANGVSKGVEETRNGVVEHNFPGSFEDKRDEAQELRPSRIENNVFPVKAGDNMQGECFSIKLVDIEKHLYMAVVPDPDILVRSSGETRLSNFLLWQTSTCPLYSPKELWPEIGLWHLVWAVLNFQRHHSYLEKKKKQF